MSASTYPILDQLIRQGIADNADVELLANRLSFEARLIKKKMSVLPTAREMEALPELTYLSELAALLNRPEFTRAESQILSHERLERVIFDDIFTAVCVDFFKTRIYTNRILVTTGDTLAMHLVEFCTRRLNAGRLSYYSLLDAILNKDQEFYKNNGREASVANWAFGDITGADHSNSKFVDGLKKGDLIDCVKTMANKQIWTRAVYDSTESGYTKVRYLGESTIAYVTNRNMDIRPYGTKALDYDWRENLKAGDLVDYFNFKMGWVLARVVSTFNDDHSTYEPCKMIELRRENAEGFNGGFTNSYNNYNYSASYYDDFGGTLKVRVHNPVVAPPHTHSNRHSTQIDDSQDTTFLASEKKPRFAILRPSSTSAPASVYFVKYVNVFGSLGGFDFVLSTINNAASFAPEVFFQALFLLKNTAENLIQPFIHEHGERLLNSLLEFANQNVDRNIRSYSQQWLSILIEAVTTLSLRIWTYKDANGANLRLVIQVGVVCLKSEILEKQFFGAKLILNYEASFREPGSSELKTLLGNELVKEGILEKIVKGHPSLIGKSGGILKILVQEGLVGEEGFSMLWGQIVKADSESRTALIALVKETSNDFSRDEIRYLLRLMGERMEDVTTELFDLVTSLRRIGYSRYDDIEIGGMADEALWRMIQSTRDIKNDVLKEVMRAFVRSVRNDQLDHYLPLAVEGLMTGTLANRNLKLLTKFLKEPTISTDSIAYYIKAPLIDSCVQSLCAKIDALGRLCGAQTVTSARSLSLQDLKTAETIAQTPEQLRLDIKRLLRFLGFFLFPKVSLQQELFKFDHFLRVFEACYSVLLKDKNLKDFLLNYLKQSRTPEHLELCKQFFTTRFDSLDSDEKVDFLPFFVAAFRTVNVGEKRMKETFVKFEQLYGSSKQTEKLVIVSIEPAEKFFGIDRIWETYKQTTCKRLYTDLSRLISRIYLQPEFADSEHSAVYQGQKESLFRIALGMFMQATPLSAQKASYLLMELIRAEESQEKPVVVSLAQLREGEMTSVLVEKENRFPREKFKVKIYENSTLYELKEALEREYRIVVNRQLLIKENKDKLSNYDNLHTLDMIDLRDGETIVIDEAESPDIRLELMNSENTDFSPAVLLVWKEVFEEFSERGLMSPEMFAEFTRKATSNSECRPEEERVKSVFKAFDQNNTGYLDFDSFLEFYRRSALASEERRLIVKKNLEALGYGKQFKLKRPALISTIERIKSTTRHVLANDLDFYETALNLLKKSALSKDPYYKQTDFVLKLFSVLPPPKRLISEAINDPISFLEGVSNVFELGLKATILNACVFRDDFKAYIRQVSIPFNSEIQENFVRKLLSKKAFKAICNGITACINGNSESVRHVGIQPAVSLLLKFMRGVVALSQAEFLDDIKSIPDYISRQKKKNEARQTDKKQEEQQTAVADGSKKDATKINERDIPDRDETELSQTKEMLIHLQIEAEIMRTVDFESLHDALLLLLHTLNHESTDQPRVMRVTLRLAATALALSVRLQPGGFVPLVSTQLFIQAMVTGLKHSGILWKIYYTNLYALLSSQFDEPQVKTTFLKILISNLKAKGDDEFSGIVELSCAILAEIGELKARNSQFAEFIHREFNFFTLFNEFQGQLLTHQSTEQMFAESEDQLLISYLALLENILNADDSVLEQLSMATREMLVHQLFSECLFGINESGIDFTKVKCHSRKSRGFAFALLRRLLKGNTRLNIHFMVKQVAPLIRHIPQMAASSAVQSDYDKKFANGFLGIRNLGCVCYMIATLQQFYCTPAFRYGVLMAQDNAEPNNTEIKGRKLDDNFFHQFQRMLSFLDFSERRDYSPLDFCLAYKDGSGQPLNVMVQQDADEFLKILVDRIETSLKKSPFLGILKSVYLGKICNIIKCQGCGYVKTNEEDFFNLSLEVKGMHNTADSLNKLIEAETISDYTCDSCKNKVDISKRALLRSLPNVLFLSLKKMYFDMELLTNVKIHSRYEFPMTMNLKKYMHVPEQQASGAEGEAESDVRSAKTAATETPLTDVDFEYKLVGVVIHKGNAEYGHYTSLINANRGDPTRKDIDSDRWYEFDDSRVSWFDIRKFDEECFGTAEDKDFMSSNIGEATISKSAYLLVYDKVKKSDLVFNFKEDQTQERQLLLDNLIDPRDVRSVGTEVHTGFYNLKQFIPEPYRTEIWEDNKMLIMEQRLLARSFAHTMADIFFDVPLSLASTPSAGTGTGSQATSLGEERVFAETILQSLPLFLSKICCVTVESQKTSLVVQTIAKALNFVSTVWGADPSRSASADQRIHSFYREQIFQNFPSLLSAISGITDNTVSSALIEYVASVTAITVRHFGIKEIASQNAEDPSLKAKTINMIYQIALNFGIQMSQNDSSAAAIRKAAKIFTFAARICTECSAVLQFFATHNLISSLVELYMKTDCTRTNPAEKTLAAMLRLINELYLYLVQNAQENPNLTAQLNRISKADIIIKAVREDYKFEEFDAVKRLSFTFCANDLLATKEIISAALNLMVGLGEAEIFGCMEMFRALLHINDDFSDQRIGLILGIPRLAEGSLYSRSSDRQLAYGLAKEHSLKAHVWNYLSPFGQERGILEQIVVYKVSHENFVMILMNYLVDFMLTIEPVFSYMLAVPPHNYLGATFFDWFSVYCEHHMKYDTNVYSTFKSELSSKRINETPEKLYALANKIKQLPHAVEIVKGQKKLFATGSNPYVNYVSYYSTEREQSDAVELWSLSEHYIIGRTLGFQVLKQVDLVTDEENYSLQLVVTLVRLAMMPSRPTGQTNLSVPAGMLLSDLSLNVYGTQNKEFLEFIGSGEFEVNKEERVELEPIFGEEDDPLSVRKNQKAPEPQSATRVKMAEDTSYLNSNYLLKFTLNNSTDQSYFVKLVIEGSEGGFNDAEVTVPIRSNRRDYLVHSVHLNHLDANFKGLKAYVSTKRSQNINMRFYSDNYPEPAQLAFEFNES